MLHHRLKRCQKWNVLLIALIINFVFAASLYLTQYDSKWINGFVDAIKPLDQKFSEEFEEIAASHLSINDDPHQPNSDEIPEIYKNRPDGILDFVPPVPAYSFNDYVHRLSKDVVKPFLDLKPRNYTQKIVILTPIHNSAKSLERYAQQLHELKYPHKLISIVFGEDGSDDGTVEVTKEVIEELKKSGFLNAQLFRFNMSDTLHGNWIDMHEKGMQMRRRKHLAEARNLLLKKGLQNEDYALWIDSDVGFLPDDLVEQLLYVDKDIVVPTCLYTQKKYVRIYDKNSWRETKMSLQDQKLMNKDELVVEGYHDSNRIYLSHLRAEGRIVKLDGVGGCTLLIKAKCHRKGLIFPEQIFDHHLETEGLAKMALSMGYGVYGLPFLEVFHS